jgi:hypothetical protein
MEDPEAYLRALAAPLASAREGSPLPVVRFSLEAVANAFVMLGLLPEARAEEILAAQRPVLEAAGFRVGLEIGELSLRRGARGFQAARAAGADSLRRIPPAAAAGPARCRLRGHDLTVTSATLTREGISLRYHGLVREGGRRADPALAAGIAEALADLSVTDDTGGTYLVFPGNVRSVTSRADPGVRRGAVDARRRVPRRARPWRGRFPRRPAGHPLAGTRRRIRPACPGKHPAARRGPDGYHAAAMANPGRVLPGRTRHRHQLFDQRLGQRIHGGT